ncbi:hypothetical protein C8P63_11659 [Melghirimyces profundicolus]|uniref:Secreted protein n=1 Tax=Melghirimyces profundicolus TaxID=1242148 RepID=A0A2T6BR00_9BACL|nr:hypothetical protein [Melghirimyces profundicolus]PTX58472.1 hypothetical protein C8P63_11659 [Melghirimyces profundicolus]
MSSVYKKRMKLLSLMIALTLFFIQNQEADTAHAHGADGEPPVETVKETAKKVVRSLLNPGE